MSKFHGEEAYKMLDSLQWVKQASSGPLFGAEMHANMKTKKQDVMTSSRESVCIWSFTDAGIYSDSTDHIRSSKPGSPSVSPVLPAFTFLLHMSNSSAWPFTTDNSSSQTKAAGENRIQLWNYGDNVVSPRSLHDGSPPRTRARGLQPNISYSVAIFTQVWNNLNAFNTFGPDGTKNNCNSACLWLWSTNPSDKPQYKQLNIIMLVDYVAITHRCNLWVLRNIKDPRDILPCSYNPKAFRCSGLLVNLGGLECLKQVWLNHTFVWGSQLWNVLEAQVMILG